MFLWLRSATRYILLTTPLCLESWTWLVAVCSTHWRDERVRSKAWNLKKQGGMTSQLHLPVKLLQLLSQGDTFVELNCRRVACEWCVYSSYHAVFYSHLHARAYCMLSYSINQALINTWSSDSCFLGKLLINDTNNWQFQYKPTHTLFSVCECTGGGVPRSSISCDRSRIVTQCIHFLTCLINILNGAVSWLICCLTRHILRRHVCNSGGIVCPQECDAGCSHSGALQWNIMFTSEWFILHFSVSLLRLLLIYFS